MKNCPCSVRQISLAQIVTIAEGESNNLRISTQIDKCYDKIEHQTIGRQGSYSALGC